MDDQLQVSRPGSGERSLEFAGWDSSAMRLQKLNQGADATGEVLWPRLRWGSRRGLFLRCGRTRETRLYAAGLKVGTEPADVALGFLGSALCVQGQQPLDDLVIREPLRPAVGSERPAIDVIVKLAQRVNQSLVALYMSVSVRVGCSCCRALRCASSASPSC